LLVVINEELVVLVLSVAKLVGMTIIKIINMIPIM